MQHYLYVFIYLSYDNSVNSLCLANTLFFSQDTFTFISFSHDTVSWRDHILTTTSRYSILSDACVNTDIITTDHLPLCFTISIDNLHIPVSSSDQTSHARLLYNFRCGASDMDLFMLPGEKRCAGFGNCLMLHTAHCCPLYRWSRIKTG